MDNSGHPWPHLADTADIEAWASTLPARSKFPILIRRLIEQVNDQVFQLEMRADEGIGKPGYDGTSDAGKATPFVPAGKAVWELGTNADPSQKANKDYRERKKNPLHAVPAETTFVFVTLRRWGGKQDWASKKAGDGFWKDVRALDLDDIDQALDQAPAVRHWLSEIIGKPASGVRTIEDWWQRYSVRTNPKLTPQMVLAGRANDSAMLLRLLQNDVAQTLVRARSVDDVLAFISATILSTEPDMRENYLGRTLIIHDAITLRRLDGVRSLLILLPYEEHLRREAELVTNHHVIFLSADDGGTDLALSDIDHDEFLAQMIGAGVPKIRAVELARAATRGLTAFRRAAAPHKSFGPPSAQFFKKQGVRRCWLVGGWNTRRSGDIEALEELVGQPFATVEDELLPLVKMDDPIFTMVGGVWGAVTRESAWELVRPVVTSSDLQALERSVQTVLGAIDPAVDLPVVDRWRAGVLGKSRIHSSELRKHLAQTLALIGSRDEKETFSSGQTGPGWARQVVDSLFARANADSTARLWSSLSDVLASLAEAAPDVFLTALQEASEGNQSIASKLFIDHTGAYSIDSPHTGLLWALEGIAWSQEYFGQAAAVLARLAEIDPGGRLSNRPSETLRSLFLVQFPQTDAAPSVRISVLDSILDRTPPRIGWALLLGLLPQPHDFITRNHSFDYRRWGHERWRGKVSPAPSGEQIEQISQIFDRALRFANADPAKWKGLAERVLNLPPVDRNRAYENLLHLKESEISDDVRVDIYESVMQQVRHYQSLANDHPIVRSGELNKYAQSVSHIAPNGPLAANRWLFESWHPDLGYPITDDFNEYEADLARRRVDAVAAIFGAGGMEEIDRLLGQTDQAWAIGFALAKQQVANAGELIVRLGSADRNQLNFASGFTIGLTDGKFDRLKELLASVNTEPLVQARALTLWTDHDLVWPYLDSLGEVVKKLYWREFQPNGLGPEYRHVNEAARNLVAYGRPATAIDLISIYSGRTEVAIDWETAVEALDALIHGGGGSEVRQLRDYSVRRVLDVVRDSEVDPNVVARLEWQLLPALGFEVQSPALYRKLANDPGFFVDVLSLCMRPKTEPREQSVSSDMATNAYRLLMDWKLVPGTDEATGHVDEAALHSWILNARRRLTEVDRLDVGDEQIGQVLAHAAMDPDGTWPEKPVREAIERVASTEVERGFYIGILNDRGITSRGPLEGGAQEKVLVEKFKHWSELIGVVWPRTAAVLRAVASHYQSEAQKEDEEAERFRQGLGE